MPKAKKKKKEPTVLDVLKTMRRLLNKGWTQFTLARGKQGRKVAVGSRAAISFCLLGAERRALSTLGLSYSDGASAEQLLRDCGVKGDITVYNDKFNRTKEEILAVVDCAIKKAKQEAAL
jgi:hypothetical protein